MGHSQQLPEAPRYLEAREAFLIAKARYERHEESLRLLFGAADVGADLERAMLQARTKGQHGEAIMKLAGLGHDLDKTSEALDLAIELQRRRVAAQQAVLNQTHRNLDE